MKNLLFGISLLLLVFVTPKQGLTQWVSKYDMVGPEGAIFDFDFFKSDTGLFVGFSFNQNQTHTFALIKRTVNAGNTWSTVNTSTTSKCEGLFAVSCPTASVAYAGGTSFLVKTTNAGISWDSIIFDIDNMPPAPGNPINELRFSDVNHGLAYTGLSAFSGNLIRTNNGAVDWNTILTDVICFYSANGKDIYSIADSKFKRSNDSGASWNTFAMPPDSSISFDIRPSIYFKTNDLGFITGAKQLLRTTNGGQSWSKISISENDSFSLSNIQFVDSLSGFIAAKAGRYFITNDGGNTWIQGRPYIYDMDFIKPYYFSKLKGCMFARVGDFTTILANSNLQLSAGIKVQQSPAIDIHIFPNPASNELQIETNDSKELKVQLFDISGKKSSENISFSNSIKLPVNELPPGIYFIQITDKDAGLVRMEKLLVQY